MDNTPVGHELSNELLHGQTIGTPPQAISPAAMITPDPDQLYYHDPSLAIVIVPNEEQRFESREEAYEFYCYYARQAGFDVRITKNKKMVGEFSCNRQGKCNFYKPGEERKKEKTSKRIGCKAFVKAKWNIRSGYWYFERIRIEHNHPLTSSAKSVQFMNAHKNKDPVIMDMVDQMHRCNVPNNATVSMFSEMYGGRQNISFIEMDLKNRKAAAAREERKNDIPKLLEFFREMKSQNPYFYYEVQLDEDHVIKNVFWSHASQRAEYMDFGDVVTFDTTYRTNIYCMPLAMFVGSNHQLQNVIFGQALLQNEKTDTFEWLFKAFKDCMSAGPELKCILTDQDSSMAAAIPKVFPKTVHRLCRWHMLKKYKEELRKLYKAHSDLKDKLHTVINHPLTPSEFEAAWIEVIDQHGIRENVAIEGLWNQRTLWVPAYFKNHYCGRMTSTQRSESVNNMVKRSGFASHMTSVNKFARKLLEVIQHTNHTTAGETHWSKAEVIRATLQPFDFEHYQTWGTLDHCSFRRYDKELVV
ncbi:protein FAR1-RELATED SEQUENCE 5-like [Phragmites australis]|uniref:protein FAR1-RELATED SEQUENCE 5-like n=1 Tax=Phragmites australis TaxID=29695 RepID=UPI002D797FDB|nr:protein FAR1-RELATED SEQUENCE 5-like [Phragmites australis]